LAAFCFAILALASISAICFDSAIAKILDYSVMRAIASTWTTVAVVLAAGSALTTALVAFAGSALIIALVAFAGSALTTALVAFAGSALIAILEALAIGSASFCGATITGFDASTFTCGLAAGDGNGPPITFANSDSTVVALAFYVTKDYGGLIVFNDF